MITRSFTKLFASITDSSIWSAPDHIVKIWITMLAMADECGIVDCTIPGLAARARKTIAEIEEALAYLSSPDPYSRTKDYAGRRIAAGPGGGWLLLNHEKYRQIIDVETSRQAKREWARRARESLANDVGEPSPTIDVSLYLRSGSDLDPEGSAEGNHPPASAGVFDAPTIAVNPKRGNVAPEDFTPTETHRVRCQELKLDVDALTREFKLFEFNRAYSDWNRRFSRWIEDARLRAEADRGKALSSVATGSPRRFQNSVAPEGGPEADDKLRAFAGRHGIDLGAVVQDLVKRNYTRANYPQRELDERLAKVVRQKAAEQRKAAANA